MKIKLSLKKIFTWIFIILVAAIFILYFEVFEVLSSQSNNELKVGKIGNTTIFKNAGSRFANTYYSIENYYVNFYQQFGQNLEINDEMRKNLEKEALQILAVETSLEKEANQNDILISKDSILNTFKSRYPNYKDLVKNLPPAQMKRIEENLSFHLLREYYKYALIGHQPVTPAERQHKYDIYKINKKAVIAYYTASESSLLSSITADEVTNFFNQNLETKYIGQKITDVSVFNGVKEDFLIENRDILLNRVMEPIRKKIEIGTKDQFENKTTLNNFTSTMRKFKFKLVTTGYINLYESQNAQILDEQNEVIEDLDGMYSLVENIFLKEKGEVTPLLVADDVIAIAVIKDTKTQKTSEFVKRKLINDGKEEKQKYLWSTKTDQIFKDITVETF